MSFYEQLVNATQIQRQKLYSVPQLRNAMQGIISKETYIAYLTEAFHHVSHTVPFLLTTGSRLPMEKKFLLPAIISYLEEEVGHEEWILNDIQACGGNKEIARHSKAKLPTQALIAYNYDYINRKNPIGFFGMVFMLESTSTQIATQGAAAVQKALQLPEQAFSYLYSHGEIDISHMKFLETTLDTIKDPDDQAAIIEVAQNTFELFADVIASIPFEEGEANAA